MFWLWPSTLHFTVLFTPSRTRLLLKINCLDQGGHVFTLVYSRGVVPLRWNQKQSLINHFKSKTLPLINHFKSKTLSLINYFKSGTLSLINHLKSTLLSHCNKQYTDFKSQENTPQNNTMSFLLTDMVLLQLFYFRFNGSQFAVYRDNNVYILAYLKSEVLISIYCGVNFVRWISPFTSRFTAALRLYEF